MPAADHLELAVAAAAPVTALLAAIGRRALRDMEEGAVPSGLWPAPETECAVCGGRVRPGERVDVAALRDRGEAVHERCAEDAQD